MTKKHILIIEPDKNIISNIKKSLDANYVITDIFFTAQDALQNLEKLTSDLAIIDFSLPDIIQTVAKIRENHDWPILFLLNNLDMPTFQKMKPMLPWSYLPKKFIKDELCFSIELAFEQKVFHKNLVNQKIKETKEVNESIISHIREGIIISNCDGYITFVNQAISQILGVKPENLMGKHWSEIVPQEQHEIINQVNKDRLSGISSKYSLELQNKITGQTIHIWASGTPLRKNNELIGTLAVFTDITSLKEAEEEKEKLIVDLKERIKEVISLYQVEEIIVKPTSLEKLFYSTAFILQKAFPNPDETSINIIFDGASYSTPHFTEKNNHWNADIEVYGEKRGQISIFSPDVENGDMDSELYEHKLLLLQGVANILGIGIYKREYELNLEKTVNERTQELYEQNLELVEKDKVLRNYMNAVEQAADAIIILDLKGKIEYVNPSFTRITGYRYDEIIDQNFRFFENDENPEIFYNEMWSTVLRGETWSKELINFRKDKSRYYAELTMSPVKDDSEKVVRLLGIQRDISQRKELDELKENFIANVTHELRTPLSIISLNTYSLINYFDKISDEKKMNLLKITEKQIEVQKEIVEQILTNSRMDQHKIKFHPQNLDLGEALRSVYSEFEKRAKEKSLDISLEIPPDLPHIYGDINQITEIIKNIMGNAVKYTEKGYVKIKTGTIIKNKKTWLHIDVDDTGYGISDAGKKYIFERFYRADLKHHPNISGTGLGLFLTKEFLKNHDGELHFETKFGEGSKFTILLPIKE